MIILGIDPGTTIIGFGVVKIDKNKLYCLDYGCIQTPPNQNIADKSIFIHKKLTTILKKFKPDIITIESLFFFKNLKTALKVSEIKGVLLFTCKNYNPNQIIIEATPLQIKQRVVGYGKATKQQVQKMVKLLLKLETIPKPDDVADALSAAIYGSNFVNKNHILN
jgi:crossover junction endodeoxyribonuclease RuvC